MRSAWEPALGFCSPAVPAWSPSSGRLQWTLGSGLAWMRGMWLWCQRVDSYPLKKKTKNPAVLKMLLCRLQRQAPEIIPPPVALKTRCHASKESAWQPQKSRSERKKRDLHLWSGDQHSSLLRMTTTMARLHLPRPGSPQNLLPDIPSCLLLCSQQAVWGCCCAVGDESVAWCQVLIRHIKFI